MNKNTIHKEVMLRKSLLPKIFRVMRITAFLLLAALVQVSAAGFAQKMTMRDKQASFKEIFEQIKLQTGYDVVWKSEQLKNTKSIAVDYVNVDVVRVLNDILPKQNLNYILNGKTFVIRRLTVEDQGTAVAEKPKGILDKISAYFKNITVTGIVTGSDGFPLPGATVTIKGEKRSTTTAVDGKFVFRDVPEGSVLQISYMGYVTKELTANDPYMNIMLQLSTSKLDEIQIMAYGTTNRRLATSNIGTVTAKEIAQQPVMNPLLALAGRVPGVSVTPTSGYASGVVKVEIRGRSNIDGKFTSEPLYVIDGVPLTYLEVGGTSGYQQGSSGVIQNGSFAPGGGQSPMFNINPADIESIDVLKDGDATAIYGSRGANGVILITTKKGKTGPAQMTVDFSQGISKNTRYWDMLNTQEYLSMRRQAFKNDGIEPTALNAPDLMAWDTTRYTNWQKELWGNTGKLTRFGANLSGGSENTVFRLGTNFDRQTEILTASGANKRASVNLSISNISLNRKFKTQLNFDYSYADVNTVVTPSVPNLAPNAPAIYDSNGELNYAEWNGTSPDVSFPFSSLKSKYRSQNKLLKGVLGLSYELLKGLEVSSTFGYNSGNNSNESYTPIAAQNPLFNPTGSAVVGSTTNENWMIEPKLNYKTTISKGTFTAFVGGTLQRTGTHGQYILGMNYTDDNLLESIQLAPIKIFSATNGDYKYAGLSGRIGYNWDEKYIINISGRRDGSSRFGPGKQYGNFGAVGLAWLASKESWIKNVLPDFISFLKFRGSYALTGYDNIGDYQYMTQWSNVKPDYTSLPDYGGITPLASLHAVNPEYRWQTNKKLEVGFNISALDDRIDFTYNYYRNRCDNQLTQYPTPIFSGFNEVTANWPASIQNSGWEAAVSAKLIQRNDFSLGINFNISANHNLLRKYPDIEHSPYYNQYVVGQPMNIKYLAKYIGVNPLNGEYVYLDYDRNGYMNIDNNTRPGTDDRYIVLNLDPKFTGAFGSDVRYKNLSLSVFFQYKNQKGINSTYPDSKAPGGMANIPREIYNNQWTQQGQPAKYAAFTTLASVGSTNILNSDLGYTDASYLRLNNVSLYYTLPKTFLKNKGINVYLQAQNLFVITGYKGIDPDIQNFGGLPTAKVITAGFSLTL